MNRYFLEVRYKGTNYAGFQKQRNAVTIQSVVEKALTTFLRNTVELTGSSRTDRHVHAFQNYFHFDFKKDISQEAVYNLNALLPADVAVKRIIPVQAHQHCRFDAMARTYIYRIYQQKDPFLNELAYYYPYHPDLGLLQQAASIIKDEVDFYSFSKRNTQVKHFQCTIMESRWEMTGPCLAYKVQANRFLRGMVKGLVGTMLQVARGNMSMEDFRKLFREDAQSQVDFSVPGHGLILVEVMYPENFFS